jgi:hypothetical protein
VRPNAAKAPNSSQAAMATCNGKVSSRPPAMGPCTQSDVCLEPSERPRLRLGNEPLQVRQHLADVVDQSCSSFGVGSLSRKASGVVCIRILVWFASELPHLRTDLHKPGRPVPTSRAMSPGRQCRPNPYIAMSLAPPP